MNDVFVKARAKINYNLIVLSKRNDGYHNIKSVFQKINLYDEIHVSKDDSHIFNFESNINELNNENNIIYKAFFRLKEQYNISGVSIKLNKRIPMQAGLGGGSSDCAAFIKAINKLFDLNLTIEEMANIGKQLGADVVPCLYGGAVLAQGIGEKVTPIRAKLKCYLVIVKPSISCNTKKTYDEFDRIGYINRKDTTDDIIKALESNDISLLSKSLYNSFEEVIDNSVIQTIKNELIQNGAECSLMTGSGSCVYGVFSNKENAKTAYEELKEENEEYICVTCGGNYAK